MLEAVRETLLNYGNIGVSEITTLLLLVSAFGAIVGCMGFYTILCSRFCFILFPFGLFMLCQAPAALSFFARDKKLNIMFFCIKYGAWIAVILTALIVIGCFAVLVYEYKNKPDEYAEILEYVSPFERLLLFIRFLINFGKFPTVCWNRRGWYLKWEE